MPDHHTGGLLNIHANTRSVAWNHRNLSTPNTTPTNSSFGAITGQDVPRVWQMSLKLAF